MQGFLFAWNHEKYGIEKLRPKIDEVKRVGKTKDTWGISAKNKVSIGDRAFITRVNTSVKGIFASGTITSKPYLFKKYNDKEDFGVDIEFDVFFDPLSEPILEISVITANTLIYQDWSPRKSGITLNPLEVVEKLWREFQNTEYIYNKVESSEITIIEGLSYQLLQTKYERSQNARMICLQHYGYSCSVCGFNFKEKYGDIGKNEFIHVHHLNTLAKGGIVATDPIKDLRPVCPNCHAMLHKRNPPYSIDDLKNMLN